MAATTQVAFEDSLDYETEKQVELAEASHDSICARLIVKLVGYLEQYPIGEIFNANTAFQIAGNERRPDVSFVLAARLLDEDPASGKGELVPDLVMEVISGDETWENVNRLMREYCTAGVQQVWLISQVRPLVVIHDSPTEFRFVTAAEELTSEALLPGFKCRVGALFQS